MQALRLELRVSAAQWAAAQAAAGEVLPQLKASADQPYAAKRARADALVWAARAWNPTDPARAFALAQEAVQLALPARPDDDNVARRWLQAQAVGEVALAQKRLGNVAAAKASALEAAALWGARPPTDGPAPVLLRWMAPVTALAVP